MPSAPYNCSPHPHNALQLPFTFSVRPAVTTRTLRDPPQHPECVQLPPTPSAHLAAALRTLWAPCALKAPCRCPCTPSAPSNYPLHPQPLGWGPPSAGHTAKSAGQRVPQPTTLSTPANPHPQKKPHPMESLLVAMLPCCSFPLPPWWTHGPALVTSAKAAGALQLPLPQSLDGRYPQSSASSVWTI